MRIIQNTESSITLILPKKQRIVGFCLTIVGVLIPILLYILNDKQISLSYNLALKGFIQSLSFWCFLGGFLTLGVLGICYFFLIRNHFTCLGHILLLILNSSTLIITYSSIYAFSPFLITGIYFLIHFKSIRCEKADLRMRAFRKYHLCGLFGIASPEGYLCFLSNSGNKYGPD